MATKAKKPEGPSGLTASQTIDGKTWILGHPVMPGGTVPCDYMFIGEKPGREERDSMRLFTGPVGDILYRTCNELGFRIDDAYVTNAVKYMPPNGKAVNAGDLKTCHPQLMWELEQVQPKLIVCLGANALKAIMGRRFKLSDYRGELVSHPTLEGVKVFTTYNPAAILHKPEYGSAFRDDVKKLVQIQRNGDLTRSETEYGVMTRVAEVEGFFEWLHRTYEQPTLVLDAEWHGVTWMDPNRYIRTIQLGWDVGHAMIIEVTAENGVQVIDDQEKLWQTLARRMTAPGLGLIGHNAIADGQWLGSFGVDIRDNVVYDTMLAEHTINETGPFNLTDMTCAYTDMGRYDVAVKDWVAAHKAECKHGYGPVPRELLLPYGAKDVDAPRRIMLAQLERLTPFMEPRGEYPSLFHMSMLMQRMLYEVEATGILVDQERLTGLVDKYLAKLAHKENLLVTMAAQLGLPNFNHRAVAQVQDLLFKKLSLTPVKTTKNKPWPKSLCVGEPQAVERNISPSTDRTVLEILEDEHPAPKLMMHIRKLDQVRKVWLRYPEEGVHDESTREGGLLSKIWPDGRIHPHFSQLKETGRLGSSKPNAQNFPKRAEGYMIKIFEGEEPPLPVRTVFVPAQGHYIIESDFKQAELFVLAALSGDETMWDALTTPGKDMHDMTAINAFGLHVYHGETPVTEDQLVAMASEDPNWEDDDSPFQQFISKLSYVNQRGDKLSRKQFKSGIRVSAKNLNFGIPYGRGALDIARQVKAETGTDTPLSELQMEIAGMMESWKTETYPKAWGYMEECAQQVTEPGYLVNPWGRYRRFPKRIPDEVLAGLQRQAQNFPIQSTVADTCMIAMHLMWLYRKRHGLNFRFINQVHDAIMVEAPIEEVEATKTMFRNTMGQIDIPISGYKTLRLGVDIEVLQRWGEKAKE
jgi:DNA polymerase